jgi:hypothetical protein
MDCIWIELFLSVHIYESMYFTLFESFDDNSYFHIIHYLATSHQFSFSKNEFPARSTFTDTSL